MWARTGVGSGVVREKSALSKSAAGDSESEEAAAEEDEEEVERRRRMGRGTGIVEEVRVWSGRRAWTRRRMAAAAAGG